jgi:hypothetical protein
MLNRKLLFAGLIVVASIMGAPKELWAKDIVIVARDRPPSLRWELQNTPSTGPLKVPGKVGDVLHFVFSANPRNEHGITTELSGDESKVQKRGVPDSKQFVLQELGEVPSQFNIDITPSKPNQEITQLEVLPAFEQPLNLMCSVHGASMLITLERSD